MIEELTDEELIALLKEILDSKRAYTLAQEIEVDKGCAR